MVDMELYTFNAFLLSKHTSDSNCKFEMFEKFRERLLKIASLGVGSLYRQDILHQIFYRIVSI